MSALRSPPSSCRRCLFSQCLCGDGARHYVHAGEEASFFTVIKRARQRQEVAVGYCDSEGQIHLNPGDKASGRRWSEADKIVVLADE